MVEDSRGIDPEFVLGAPEYRKRKIALTNRGEVEPNSSRHEAKSFLVGSANFAFNFSVYVSTFRFGAPCLNPPYVAKSKVSMDVVTLFHLNAWNQPQVPTP